MNPPTDTLLPVYLQAPFQPVRALGSRVWDSEGRDYLDLAGGIACTPLGHCHPELVAVAQQQAEQLWHASNFYAAPSTLQLAEELIQHTFADRVFFTNSGGEAVEAAVKIARRWQWKRAGEPSGDLARHKILCFTDSFHGRSLLGISLGHKQAHRSGFGPLPQGIDHLPYNSSEALAEAIDDTTAAVLIEPILGEAGVIAADDDFLRQMRARCDATDTLLIFDEVQSGNGRTGPLFRYMDVGIEPDILATAKGLANGLPLGAVLVREQIAAAMDPGSHGSTFGGNPLACAVALRNLQLLRSPEVIANSARRTEQLRRELPLLGGNIGLFTEVRVHGMWAGCDLAESLQGRSGELQALCWEEGVLVLPAGDGNALRLAPALNITEEELSEGLRRLNLACAKLTG